MRTQSVTIIGRTSNTITPTVTEDITKTDRMFWLIGCVIEKTFYQSSDGNLDGHFT